MAAPPNPNRKRSAPKRTFLSKSLSIHPEMYASALARAEALGMSFSQYAAQCLRRDLDNDGGFTVPVRTPKKPGGGAGDKW